jgi:hypothetical protein
VDSRGNRDGDGDTGRLAARARRVEGAEGEGLRGDHEDLLSPILRK